MRKNTKRRSRRRIVKYILLLFLLSYIGALTLPYAAHKEVSAAYREEFQKKNFYSDTPSPERAAYIDDNMDALLFRLRMIEDAREEIILSTFDFNDDEAGRDIMASLLHAAEEGVSVRIIVDGISGFLDMRNQPSFLALASHENVSVKIYNPVNLLLPWKLQARLHDKYLIIDKTMYLLGGRNTTNLFLGEYSSSQNIDRELFVRSFQEDGDTSVNQLLSYFWQV
ncbi:MAG: phospholipase D-like domain-containing protein [Ruminococcus sp.]|jgi:putative cardiolipin synthase